VRSDSAWNSPSGGGKVCLGFVPAEGAPIDSCTCAGLLARYRERPTLSCCAIGGTCEWSAACRIMPPCFFLEARTEAVNTECCDEPTDCSSGRPSSCNKGCADILVPFFQDCADALGDSANDYDDVVGQCREQCSDSAAAAGGGGGRHPSASKLGTVAVSYTTGGKPGVSPGTNQTHDSPEATLAQ
jgi:hypothetical protein